MSTFPSRESLIDLRAAAASDGRERDVAHALDQLRAAARDGHTVEMTWPTDRDAAHAATYLGAPLALLVTGAIAGTPGALVLHTRTGNEAEFLLSPPSDRITFVFHLNSEEAAMRWERQDPAPARRLAAAAHLRNAGWQVWACVGPVRLFSGWRDEYRDLAERAAAAGVQRLLVSFPGDDVFELGTPQDVEGLDAVAAGNGYTFTISARHRREVWTFLTSCISEQPAAGVLPQGGRSSQLPRHGSRNRRTHFGVRVPGGPGQGALKL